MGSFDPVVQALVRPMISIRHEVADRPDVTAQLVGDHDPRRAKPVDQPLQEPAGGLCITLLLHENVEHIPIRVDCPPKPELHAIDRNNDFIQVPFVTGARPVALDAIGEMAAKPVHPVPDGFPADHHAAFGQQILDICRAQRKPMVSPDGIGDDLAGKTKALQASNCRHGFHDDRLSRRNPVINLAMPLLVVGGGYIGLELAAVARKRGLKVTLLEQAPRILGRVACSQTADYFRHLHTENGVTLREGVSIESFEGPEQRPSFVKLTEGDEVSFDVAVFGIGLLPNDTIAREAGLECAGGIIVDGWGRTSDPDIRAAGDCARLPYRGDMIRLESVHNAIAQAEHIADDIVCPGAPSYAPVPWFWSDQYDCKLQIAGLNLGYTKVVTRPGTKPGAFSNWYFKGEEMIACDAINDARSFMMAKRWLAVAHRPCPELICDPSWDLAKF